MFGSTTSANPNNDPELSNPPSETVSSVSWSPKANYIVAGSWDKTVSCWEVQASGTNVNSVAKARHTAQAPVLCTDWYDDGSKVFLGGCDKKAFMWDLASNQAQQVGEHGSAINCISFFRSPTAGELVVTGSWDKTLKFWDVRQPKMVLSHTLSDKISCMDVKYPLCAVATENKKVTVYNLEQPQNPFKEMETQLKLQTRCVSCFVDKSGFTVGSIEGRVRVEYLNPTTSQQSFAFKCHRDTTKNLAYAVNSMSFHPVHGTFVTAGSDGAFHFWDKDSKQRLKQFKSCSAPITCASFSHTGDLLAYAVGYDWSKGAQSYNEYKSNNHIYIHPTPESEIKSKPKKKGFR